MTDRNIAYQRLHNQCITRPSFEGPAEIVQWLGAVQAQDYGAAKWALGLRLKSATEEAIEKAFTKGEILRTHVLRPTWHFVTPGDIRWMLNLTAPFINAYSASYNRKLELDSKIFLKSNSVLAKALQGGKQLTRIELEAALKKAGIATNELRFIFLMARAELDQVVCSGGRRGKQFTYALLDERVPPVKPLSHEESLAKLAQRYFTSHGPATIQDFTWWSGLNSAKAKLALEMVKPNLDHRVTDEKIYWFSPAQSSAKVRSEKVYLLPAFDEYTVAYKDRTSALDSTYSEEARKGIFNFNIVIGGKILGSWKRTLKKDAVEIKTLPFKKLSRVQHDAINAAAKQYGKFVNKTVVLI